VSRLGLPERPSSALSAHRAGFRFTDVKEGDKVYLLIKNIKGKRLSKKLDYIKVGLFSIKKAKGLINYKL